VSLVKVVKRLNQALNDGDAGAFLVPGRADAVEQALLLYEADPDNDRRHLVDGAWRRMRVTFSVPMESARGIGARLDHVRRLADEHGVTAKADVQPSGYLPLYVRMMEYVLASQVSSFGWALLIVGALMLAMLRSVRLLAVAVPPNALPIVATLGTMGLGGIRLDVATVTIAAIALGLVVDNTIHYLYRYRVERDAGAAPAEAIARVTATAGRAMAITTVVLCAGFAVLMLATVQSIALFGGLMCFTMLTALLGDLVVLPAVLMVTRARA
jgi:hypothetical protein